MNPALDPPRVADRLGPVDGMPVESAGRGIAPLPSFNQAYEQHFDMVWCGLRSLGVRDGQLDDASQDVFLVVHRRLGDFAGRSTLKTWIYGIVVKVAKDYRRLEKRKGGLSPVDFDITDLGPNPEDHAGEAQSRRALATLLETLDEDKREVFVLAEIEELTAPEIAEALELNLNTVYSRLRAARREFEAAIEEHGEKLR